MSKKINIGVLGCANIAERYIVPTINELNQNFQLFGIASRSMEKSKRFAKKFNTKAFFSYEALLQEAHLEAIYIPLPNSLHYEWIKKALQKGLHVLVEKSLACTYKEVLELNTLAKENELVLIENFQFRFHSQLQFIKNELESGKIGELRNIRSSFGFPPFSDKTNIRYNNTLGGGALLDAGAYPLKIAQEFLGSNVYVDSASLFINEDLGVDIYGSACIKQKNSKITAQIAFGFDQFYQCNIELWGSKGRIYTNRIFTSPATHEPIIEIETKEGKEIIKLKPDHHFKNMLIHFYLQIFKKDTVENEYLQNTTQARLIEELKYKSQ